MEFKEVMHAEEILSGWQVGDLNELHNSRHPWLITAMIIHNVNGNKILRINVDVKSVDLPLEKHHA